MNDYDPACASEQACVAGSDSSPFCTGSGDVLSSSAPLRDWHRADIIAAVRKTNTTLSALSRQHGLSSITLANVLVRKWPRAERIVAEHLGLAPWVIWPSRYPRVCPSSRPGPDVAEPDDTAHASVILPDPAGANLSQRKKPLFSPP